MFLDLFYGLRDEGVPVGLQEWRMLMEALSQNLHGSSLLRFYNLARACLIKSETYYDAYDRVFAHVFHGVEGELSIEDEVMEWLNDPENFRELTDEERGAKLPSGKQTVIKNRVGWSRTYLKKAGLLVQPQRGHVQITQLGLQALQDRPDRIDVKYLKQYEAFMAFHTAKPSDTSPNDNRVNDNSADPTERLEKAHGEIQQELVAELLETIKQQPPQFLENLVGCDST